MANTFDKPDHESAMARKPAYQAPAYRGSAKLAGKVAIITGGDSGIGRAVAILFAREGADIALGYLCEHDDAALTCRGVEAEGRRCIALAGDVCDPDYCQSLVAQTLQAYSKLDILVNNAAYQQQAPALEAIPLEQWERTVHTNVFGYVHMLRAALPHLAAGASIINTGSVVGLRGNAHLLDYASSKGAIHALTKSLAANLLARGIRVNAVAPGPVWTPLNPADQPPEQLAEFGKHTDMGRPAEPEELSPAYVFLAAPVCSAYITGLVLPVTGSVGAI